MEVVEEGKGPKVKESQGLWVKRSKGPEDQDISNSNSNTSLTLKKVHLVFSIFYEFCFKKNLLNCIKYQCNESTKYKYFPNMLKMIFVITKLYQIV